MCFDLTHAPVATTARGAATGPVSMSTRPDPEGSDTVEIATRRSPRLWGSVGLARAHPLAKSEAMEPSRQTWSSYGPTYTLGRWSSEVILVVPDSEDSFLRRNKPILAGLVSSYDVRMYDMHDL